MTKKLSILLRVSLPLIVAGSVFAQDDGGRVIVTGSLIPTAEEVTASPLDTITQAEINRAGTQDVLQVLQKRNADIIGAGNLGSTNANIASGSTLGGSVVQIRGLPTLVLFEGRRIADSAALAQGGAQFSDVNLFPSSLIARIDILKDGASALYGSDAVGGVINIFLKKDYTGVEIGARYGFTPESAVAERKAYMVAGLGNDTTHITIGLQYYEIDPLFLRERSYSATSFGTSTFGGIGVVAGQSYLLLGNYGTTGGPLNSPNNVYGPTFAGTRPTNYNNAPLAYAFDPRATSAIFNLSNIPTSTLDQTRLNAYAAFSHQIFGKALEFFGDFLYSKNHSESFLNAQPVTVAFQGNQVNPRNNTYNPATGLPTVVGTNLSTQNGVTLGGNQPFNPFNNTATLTVRNRYITNPRIFDNDSQFYRFLTGLKSTLKDWTFEGAFYYSSYTIDFKNFNLVNALNYGALINGTAIDPATGLGAGRLDPFSLTPVGTGAGQVSQSAFNTIFGTNFRNLVSYQRVFDFKVSGFPFQLPAGPLGVAFGAEYRNEGFKIKDSPEIFLGSVPVQEINTSRFIYSAYAEISIPIVSAKMKIPGVYSLELDLAGRYDHYEGIDKDARVPKVSLRYQPIKDLTLRATYSNSFVAPNLYQLFGPSSTGFSSPPQLSPGPGQPAVQLPQTQAMSGSNPGLVPSLAESYTAGMVYSPSYVPGLTVSIDYFRTLQRGAVSTLGSQTILNSVNTLGAASPYYGLVTLGNFRGQQGATPAPTAPYGLFPFVQGGDSAGPNAVYLVDTNFNGGAARVEGIDFNLHYTLDLKQYGSIEFLTTAVLFTKNDIRLTPTDPYYSIKGLDAGELFGNNPDYRVNFSIDYRWGGLTVGTTINYTPEVRNFNAGSVGDDHSTLPRVDSYVTVDGRVSYEFGKGKKAVSAPTKTVVDAKGGPVRQEVVSRRSLLDGVTIAVGCNNMFDRKPPFIAGANSNTDLSYYDPYQRFVYFEISKKF